MTYQLGVIGGGNMAEAVIAGAVGGGILPAGRIVVADPLAQRREHLADKYGIAGADDNKIPGSCRRVMLAVKPHLIGEVLEEIASAVQPEATIISIAAGITAAFMDGCLGGRGHIVRVMPNTPMLVGAGASAVAAGPRATDDDVRWTRQLFAAGGLAVIVDESQMDAVTGLSGSGPAYLFYLAEAMAAAGVAQGLAPEIAEQLAVQTCVGAGRLLAETKESSQALRQRVTTPNGTTARAIETLDEAGVKDAIVQAIRRAAQRSRELGK
ncbi:MAG: pyrroline-5-carboxylate reductase [Phycisphaerae bacterium]|nr:pyrroline-5-carboxylate reductase [Phycisphaerae bacterium]